MPYEIGLHDRLRNPEYAAAYLSAASAMEESVVYRLARRQLAKAASKPRDWK